MTTIENDTIEKKESNREKAEVAAGKVTGWTRFIAGVPAVGLFLCALVLAVYTFIEMILITIEVITENGGFLELATEYVEFADMFLLAVALYIMALGLFTLFVTDKVPLPDWLTFHDFDDLKERLVSVICVMLGVYFLGVVMKGAETINLVFLAVAVSITIIALTLFVKLVIKSHD